MRDDPSGIDDREALGHVAHEAVAEEYAPLGHTEFSTNINKLSGSGADIVFSDLVGDSIVAFYKQFRQFGLKADDIPICTPITTEQEIAAMGAENAMGHYTSFNYFKSVDTPENKSFVERSFSMSFVCLP